MSMEDIPPDILDQLIAQYLGQQQQMDPSMMTGEMMMTPEMATTFGMMPSYDLRGKPYTMNQQLNQLQDVNQIMADPLFQGIGGVGGFGAEAFQPTTTYERVDSPEYNMWQNYRRTPMSLEGMIAAELDGGGTPLSAVRKLQQRVQANPDGQLAQELGVLYGTVDEVSGNTTIDWQAVAGKATDLEDVHAKLPQIGPVGATIGPNGEEIPGGEIIEQQQPDGSFALVQVTTEPSPLQEKYEKLGLPNPYEEYTAESFLPPDWGNQVAALDETMGNVDVARQAMLDAYQAMVGFTPGQQRHAIPARTDEQQVAATPDTNVPTRDELDMVNNMAEQAQIQAQTGYDPLSSAYLPPSPRAEPEVIGPLAEQLIAEGQDLPEHWTYVINPDGSLGEPLPNEGGGSGNRVQKPAAYGLMRQGKPRTGEEPEPPGPGDVFFPQGGTVEGGTVAEQVDEGERAAVRNQLRQGLPIPDYLRDAYEAMLTEIPPIQQGRRELTPVERIFGPGAVSQGPTATAPTADALDAYLAQNVGTIEEPGPAPYTPPASEQARRTWWSDADTPPGVDRTAWHDYLLQSVMPQYATGEAARRGEGESVRAGQQAANIAQYLRNATARPRTSGSLEGRAFGLDPAEIAQIYGSQDTARELMLEQMRLQDQQPRYQFPGGGRSAGMATGQNVRAPSIGIENEAYGPRYQFPYGATGERGETGTVDTGERRGNRTDEERRQQARERAPRGLQGERYEATTGMGGQLGGRRGRYQRARQAFRQGWLEGQQMMHQTYGAEEGYARGMARALRDQGISPLQQVLAQRMQNVLNAGIPIQSAPQVVRY